MRAAAIVLLLSCSLVSPRRAVAWNDKGHMVIARLAWLKLSEEQHRAATDILKAHPHYAEYLTAERPNQIAVDEWAFLRASYWPDWVRSNHSEQYNRPTWHYISAGFVPAHSMLKPELLASPAPNVVTQIPFCVEKIRTGSAEERAVHLCWLLHLTGDIHQPLHCCSLLSEAFPEGDRGGNLSLVKFADGLPVQLHPTWDNLLGTDCDLDGISKAVLQLQQLEQGSSDQPARLRQDHTAAAEWAKEGFDSARAHAYLNGDLRPANLTSNPATEVVPALAPCYLADAREIAQSAAVRAGNRLANTLRIALGTLHSPDAAGERGR
jgi:hypothetical protein